MWRLKPAVLLGACWAWIALRIVRRRLQAEGLRMQPLPAPRLPASASRGVLGILRRCSPTCLERALVHQAWLKARQVSVDVVIGVPQAGFSSDSAHAWLDGFEPSASESYAEVFRLHTS